RRPAVQRGHQVLPVLVGHHAEVDLDAPYALDLHEPVPDVGGDPVLHRTPRGGERDAHGHDAALYLHPAHHVEGDGVPPYLGIPNASPPPPSPSLRETIRRLARRLVLRDAFLRRPGVRVPPGPLVNLHQLTSVESPASAVFRRTASSRSFSRWMLS